MKSTPEQQKPPTLLAGLNPAPTSVVTSPKPTVEQRNESRWAMIFPPGQECILIGTITPG